MELQSHTYQANMAKNLVPCAGVQEVLTFYNYAKWSICMKNYLLSQDLWDIIQIEREPEESEEEYRTWRQKNAMALNAIQISCGQDIISHIFQISSAQKTWKLLDHMHHEQLPPEPKLKILEPWQGTKASDDYRQYFRLHWDLSADDWDAVKNFLDQHQEDPGRVIIHHKGWRILHAAAIYQSANIVKELTRILHQDVLEIEDFEGRTALSIAAELGSTQMAEWMVEKNRKLVLGADKNGMIPIVRASSKGYIDTVRYLYSVTPFDLENLTPEMKANGASFICNCLVNKMIEFALDLLKRYPSLAVAPSCEGVSPMFTLSQMPSAFPSGSHLVWWQWWIYSRICLRPQRASDCVSINIPKPDQGQLDRGSNVMSVYGKLRGLLSHLLNLFDPGIKQIYDTKLINAQTREFLSLARNEISELADEKLREGSVYKALFKAVQHGCIELLNGIMEANLSLVLSTEMNGRHIIMCAVAYRQEKIFNIVYWHRKCPVRLDMLGVADRFENSTLHLAGMLPPPGRLDHISGAALQMQRELQWFKAVESITPPRLREDRNLDGKTPRELFTEQHMNLVKEGEKWMKDTATSCTIVAALVVTITFVAAFTVPGGNNGGTGFPLFLKERLFKVFIVSDAVSFFASSTSLLLFVEILTARYGEEYFLESLPRKMLIGLTTFFLSIATMMIAFCCALFLMLRGESWWLLIPVNLLACVPVCVFIFSKFPLLIEIFMSTYGPSIFDKREKK